MTADLIALVTLTLMEIVLGIDNIIFLAIVAGRVPKEQQARRVRSASSSRWEPGSRCWGCCSSCRTSTRSSSSASPRWACPRGGCRRR